MKFQTPAEFSEWMRKKAYDAVIATSNLPWYSPTEKKNRKQSIQHRRLPL